MHLILNQDLQGETVKRVEYPDQHPGLKPGDVIVSLDVLHKVKNYLENKELENRQSTA